VTAMATPARLAGHGLAVQLTGRWEARIYRRPDTLGSQANPVLHLANFALPAVRGDYGTGAVEQMTAADIFIALVEFGADCLGTALYASQGLPTVTRQQFNPNGLQRRLAGQAGCQHFFTQANRPFCLYIVIGALRQAGTLTPQVNAMLAQIHVDAL
jgi:hypothetical protein